MNEEIREMKITNLALALQEKGTIKAAAAHIDISERQAHRWLRDPDNLEIIKNINREVRTRCAMIVAEGKLGSYEKLVHLSQFAESESIQLKASLEIIHLDSRLMFEMEQDFRLQRIENLVTKYRGEE